MAILLFKLRNVPDDEASEVRDLLTEHDIPFYETTAGNWGISMPAIWLHNDEHYIRARSVLDAYQHERASRMREQYLADKSAGRAETLTSLIRKDPLRTLGYLVLIAAVIYLSISIFY
ncbi:MAG: DUF6164 family protein [Pseudohongiella sp.]|nr:DUF6164 family protein [Pseudohongiella sp.]MDO9519115.1 DUF6164 family protein [Pseudohongiella sp.]